jgi:hypothetical protein
MFNANFKMDDVQTREKTLMELHELWSTGLRLSLQGYQTALDTERAKKLETALEMLEHQLTYGYQDFGYGRVINELPEAKDLADYTPPNRPDPKPNSST